MDEIKTEYNLMCHGCLSNDRQMTPLGVHSELFMSLIGNQKQCVIYSMDDIKLCWECTATMKKFKLFQMQLRKAQEMLVQFLYGLEIPPISLSKLKTSTKLTYDQELQHRKLKRKIKTIDSFKKDLLESIETDDKKQESKERITKPSIVEDLKIDLSVSIENELNGSVIKTEIVPELMAEENKTDIYAVELLNHINNDNKPEKYADKLKSLADHLMHDIENELDDHFDNESDILYDIKTEKVKSERKEKKIKRKSSIDKEQWHTYTRIHKEYAKLIENKKKDWGDIQSYFTKVFFNEQEMEEHIFVKERHFSDHTRYPYSCNSCKLGYKLQLDLKRHNNLNHLKPGASHKCSYCHNVQPSQLDLESHWREHTPIAKCNLCSNVLRPRGMKQHLNTAHTRCYSCHYCTMKFETLSKFGDHFRKMHMKFTCDYCKKNFKSKSRIAYHIRNSHVPAFCVDCNRSYLNRSQLQKHCILMHPQRANRSEAREACFCVECDKQYSSVAQYRKHLKVSTKHVEVKKETTPCPDCGKMFARKLYMKNHYNLYHLKKTKFYCELCDKYFARAFGLRVHNTHVHQKVQRVRDKICDLCGRAFTNNRTMMNHRRTHTGERPHKCLYCTAEFIQKYAMQTHMRTQHKHFT